MFVDEFAAISRCCVDAELLYNVTLVWQELLCVASVRPLLLSSDAALAVGMHLLKQSMCSSNSDLEMQSQDMVD